MSNNGKSLTNVSFRAKILEVIDKLKNQDKTALVRHVDDFEALNKDTFEAGMNALIEAIPGGGGGGTGDGGYVVTFGIDFDNNKITCDKTIDDIIAHADKHIVGRFVVEDLPMDGVPATIDMYCDNLKFDYQQINSDDPSVTPIIPTYTYLGFSGDAFILDFLQNQVPRENSPVEDDELQYYKACISIYYIFDNDAPYWEINLSEIGGNDEPTDIFSTDIMLYGSDSWMENEPRDYTNKWNSDQLTLQVTSITTSTLYPDGTTVTGPFHNARLYKDGHDIAGELIDAFLPSAESGYYRGDGNPRSALASPSVIFDRGAIDIPFFIKPAQLDILVDLDTYLVPGRGTKRGVFTVAGITSWPTKNNVTGYHYGGGIILYMDEYDTTITSSGSNRLIRHYLKIYRPADDVTALCDYCQWEIPYTDIWSNS